jgi:anti-sigma factor RsiW
LTALIDGELRAGRAERVRAHLEGCARCAAERAASERSVAEQRRCLAASAGGEVAAVDRMFAAVRRRMIAEEPEPVPHRVRLGLAGAALAGALLVLAVARFSRPALIAFGLEQPPKAVAEKPELFLDYSLFEHLDELEHFDTVEKMLPPRSSRRPSRG